MIKLKTLFELYNQENLINELRVLDISKNKEETHKYFILYKDKLFILDEDSNIKNLNTKIKQHLKTHPQLSNKKKDSYMVDNVYDVLSNINWDPLKTGDVSQFLLNMAEISPEIVVGNYDLDTNRIRIWNHSEIDPTTSLNVKKLAKQLNIKHIDYSYQDFTGNDDEIEKIYNKKQLKGEIPPTLFHGTNSKVLNSILKYGLDPGRGPSRFSDRDITHIEHIFFAATFEQSTYYAFNATEKEKNKWNVFPIIIELSVPDKNLIVPDFDADVSTTSSPYFNLGHGPNPRKTSMKAMGISRETGKWGYKGRIPAKFIKYIYYYKPLSKIWKKSKPDIWRKLLDKYDWETIGYKLELYSQDQL